MLSTLITMQGSQSSSSLYFITQHIKYIYSTTFSWYLCKIECIGSREYCFGSTLDTCILRSLWSDFLWSSAGICSDSRFFLKCTTQIIWKEALPLYCPSAPWLLSLLTKSGSLECHPCQRGDCLLAFQLFIMMKAKCPVDSNAPELMTLFVGTLG